jgi:hypothetical protein
MLLDIIEEDDLSTSSMKMRDDFHLMLQDVMAMTTDQVMINKRGARQTILTYSEFEPGYERDAFIHIFYWYNQIISGGPEIHDAFDFFFGVGLPSHWNKLCLKDCTDAIDPSIRPWLIQLRAVKNFAKFGLMYDISNKYIYFPRHLMQVVNEKFPEYKHEIRSLWLKQGTPIGELETDLVDALLHNRMVSINSDRLWLHGDIQQMKADFND